MTRCHLCWSFRDTNEEIKSPIREEKQKELDCGGSRGEEGVFIGAQALKEAKEWGFTSGGLRVVFVWFWLSPSITLSRKYRNTVRKLFRLRVCSERFFPWCINALLWDLAERKFSFLTLVKNSPEIIISMFTYVYIHTSTYLCPYLCLNNKWHFDAQSYLLLL